MDPKPQDQAASPPLDTGLGVPPRPPTSPPSFKDPIMGRSPFAAGPSSGPNFATQPSSAPAMPTGANPPMPPSAPRPPGPPIGRTGRDAPPSATERRTLVVGRGISVQGMVQDAERLVVEGTVEASMIHATELSVSAGGVFRGEIEVEDAEVAGTVDGTVVARGNLVVRATGVVLGTARCRRLQVEDGGQITGRMEMMSEPARAPEAARPAASQSSAVQTGASQASTFSPALSYES